MEVEMEAEDVGTSKGKKMLVILVGAPGSGKSSFCEDVMRASSRPWDRICQDNINNGKSETKAQCLKEAGNALNKGKSILIDRCNLDKEQRAEFVRLGNSEVEIHAVVLDLPAKLCVSRVVKRIGHEGNLHGGKAAAAVNRMLQKKELPKLSEGFFRITYCTNEADVKDAVKLYSALGPTDTLPHGYFGQKHSNTKVQLGIMKFMKKSELPSSSSPDKESNSVSESGKTSEKEHSLLGVQDIPHDASSLDVAETTCSQSLTCSGSVDFKNHVPTLAFPSISTADFQFDLEKASDIIVEKVAEFVKTLGNARLVLVDLSHRSKILSLVKARVAQKNIDPKKFFTFVGDITRLYSEGGLHCNVIANAANWRLKPGGGGVNAAIFKAAGSQLETATVERAKSLLPGKSLVVPLPKTSPLYSKEGVTHVIHVLGPNMNPKRPNFLDDYSEGCKVLCNAYTSLFEGFLSILKDEVNSHKRSSRTILPGQFKSEDPIDNQVRFSPPGQRLLDPGRFEDDKSCESDRGKKYKKSREKLTSEMTVCVKAKTNDGKAKSKSWGSWAQRLYSIAMNPEGYKDSVLELSDDTVVINDAYPKARKHLLVLARKENLDSLDNARKVHLPILVKMHEMGMKWVKKFQEEDKSLIFRLGYHSVPSMRQLHLHVVSQDFASDHCKIKKHWNAFNTEFFLDSVDVMEEVSNHGAVSVEGKEVLLSMELRCHRCKSAHPNLPRLKSHIRSCNAPFPSFLLQKNRLLVAPVDTTGESVGSMIPSDSEI